MGKAIYVMDTPKSCTECPLSLETEVVNTIICRGCEKYSINPRCTEKPDWCPLKEVPQKCEERSISEYEFGSLGKGYEVGWNACLKAILNGGKNKDEPIHNRDE